MITREEKLMIMKNRLNKLENSIKCAKAPGVKKHLIRRIRNLENAGTEV